jgi:hypothetical protein
MYTRIRWIMNRSASALLILAAVMCSTVSAAKLKPTDHGAAVIDGNGLMWANTVGTDLGWDPAGGPGTAQAWIANLNATDYGGFDDWMLPTGDFNVAPNTTTNQLGELFYTDCGNSIGQQTSLRIHKHHCRKLSALGSALQAGMGLGGLGLPGDILISSSTFLGEDFPGCNEWAVFDTASSSQRPWTCDTSYNGIVGEADVLAVRFAGTKPHKTLVGRESPSSSVPEPGTLALLALGGLGLAGSARGRRRLTT